MSKPSADETHRSGFIALVGRPNSGKSTLLNQLLGQKLSIVTDKPQTTRRRILGIKNVAAAQLILVDVPGIHRARDLLNRRMVDVAERALRDADVGLWIVEACRTGENLRPDPLLMNLLSSARARCCVALNKVDLVEKKQLLPQLAQLAEFMPGVDIVPISALTGLNLDRLASTLAGLLPPGPAHFPEDSITDLSERTMVEETVREKVTLVTQQEVPYALAVTVDSFAEQEGRNLVVIHATIHVNRRSQKPIIVGHGGEKIKRIGQLARKELEQQLGRRVYLELFVRVQEGWTRDVKRLAEFGL